MSAKTTNKVTDWKLKQFANKQDQLNQSSSSCPSCGYCQHCGRGGHSAQPWAIPMPAPYPQYPNPYIHWGTLASQQMYQ